MVRTPIPIKPQVKGSGPRWSATHDIVTPTTPRRPRLCAPKRPGDVMTLAFPERATSVEPVFYKISDAERVLRMSRTVIYGLIRTGRLRTVKEGRARLIPVSAIHEYAALLEREAGESK